MKLQLDENTLNAYINEAIKRELNEAGWLPFLKKAGEKAAKTATKKTAPVVQKSGEAFKNLGKSKGAFGFRANSKRVGNARAGLRGAGSERGAEFVTGKASKTMGGKELKYVVKTVKDEKTGKKVLQFLDTEGKKLEGDQLKLARSNFKLRSQQFKDIRKMGNLNRGIVLTAVAGGIGTAVAASQSGSRNPDAPWNDGNQDNSGGNDGGFDGTFPWDNTEPQWAPPRQRKNTGTTSTNVDTGTSVQSTTQDSAQQRREIPDAIQPITRQLNIPTGAERRKETLPRPTDDAFHKNVAKNMLNIASLSAGDMSQREKNAAIKQVAKNGIEATRSQNYGGRNPKDERELIRHARNTLLRGDQNPNI